jgi:hypothetical protein
MVLVYIHAGTWTFSVINSRSMAFTMATTGIIAVFMFVESSFYPILILLTTIPPLIKSLMSSYTRFHLLLCLISSAFSLTPCCESKERENVAQPDIAS